MTQSISNLGQKNKMRKPHTKSRRGCRPCKNRRVKCDEQGPPCVACAIRGFECDFVALARPQTDNMFVLGYDNYLHSGSTGDHVNTDPQHGLPRETSYDSTPPFPSESMIVAPFNNSRLQDLELMHHFTAHTYKSLSVAGLNEEVWQVFVPREALKEDYLMHGVMGLAALHLSYENPTQRQQYLKLTSHHQDYAFALFRDALDGINKDNCHSMFAFSVIAMVYAIASPNSNLTQSSKKAMDSVFVLFDFLQGITTIAVAGWDWIIEGPFGIFLDIDRRVKLEDIDEKDKPMIARLRRLNDTYLAVVDPIGHSAIGSAIDLLEKTLRGGDVLVLSWLSMCGKHYLALLRQGQRLAQLVFIHWAILLHRLSRLWWVKDMANLLIEETAPDLETLGQDWSEAVLEVRSRVGRPGPT